MSRIYNNQQQITDSAIQLATRNRNVDKLLTLEPASETENDPNLVKQT